MPHMGASIQCAVHSCKHYLIVCQCNIMHHQASAWGCMPVPGAGKTTLLTALAGRASYGVLSGTVTINGRCAVACHCGWYFLLHSRTQLHVRGHHDAAM